MKYSNFISCLSINHGYQKSNELKTIVFFPRQKSSIFSAQFSGPIFLFPKFPFILMRGRWGKKPYPVHRHSFEHQEWSPEQHNWNIGLAIFDTSVSFPRRKFLLDVKEYTRMRGRRASYQDVVRLGFAVNDVKVVNYFIINKQ